MEVLSHWLCLQWGFAHYIAGIGAIGLSTNKDCLMQWVAKRAARE